MAKLLIKKDWCKSCGLCIGACPQEALIIGEKVNNKGYKHVKVDDKKCVQCGICYNVCPDYVFEITE